MSDFKDCLFRTEFLSVASDIVDAKINQKVGYSFAINGEWGCGKSTILNMLQEQLDKRYLVIRYNCWKNDIYEDPLIPLLCEFADALNKEHFVAFQDYEKKALKIAGASIKGLSKLLLQSQLGLTVDAIAKFVAETGNLLVKPVADTVHTIKDIVAEKHIKTENIETKLPIELLIEQIRENLSQLTAFEGRGIVLMVDELDRCLPDYAIKVLERLHHVFDGTRIIQIIAINKKELSGSIAKAFGQFEEKYRILFADHYLQKFIEMTLNLDNGSLDDKELRFLNGIENNFVENKLTTKKFLIAFCKHVLSGIPMRNIQQIIKIVDIVHQMTERECPCSTGRYTYSLLIAEILETICEIWLHYQGEIYVKGIGKKDTSKYTELQISVSGESSQEIKFFYRNMRRYFSEGANLVRLNDMPQLSCLLQSNTAKSLIKFFYYRTDQDDVFAETIKFDNFIKVEKNTLVIYRKNLKKVSLLM
ncbi:MAG: hypothetical protein J6T62_03705 [Fibrobacter sp.]|nr:hypothetical protein [Fibrobacter sp.]